MSRLLIMLLLLGMACSMPVFAAEESAAKKDFAQDKAKRIEKLDQRIAHLQKVRECAQAATDHEALKACREKPKKGKKD